MMSKPRAKKDPPVKETNDRWITQYGDFEFLPGPNCTPEQAKAKNELMMALRKHTPRITEASLKEEEGRPDRTIEEIARGTHPEVEQAYERFLKAEGKG